MAAPVPAPATCSPAATARQVRRRRRWSFVLTALLLGCVVALALVEGAFRLFWEMPPAFAGFGQAGMYVSGLGGTPMLAAGYTGTLRFGGDEPSHIHINNLGMRGKDVGPREPGQRRVLVVGDSLPFGYGVDDDESFPALLEASLIERGIPAVVGNGGVPGFASTHAVARMHLLDQAFEADALIVCGFLGNDAVEDALSERVVYAGLMHGWPMSQLVQTSWRTRLAMKSRFALWLETWIFTNKREWSPMASVHPDPELLQRAAGLPPDEGHRLAGLFLDVRNADHTWVPGTPPPLPRLLGYLRDSLERAKQIAGGRPLLFVMLPTSWHLDERKRLRTLRTWGYDPEQYRAGLLQQRWREVAEGLGIPAFDATPILRAAGDTKQLFIQDGGHLTVRGNRIVGNWLADELAKRL